MKKLLDTPTHSISVPDNAVVNAPLRVISVADFFDRLPDAAVDKLVASNAAFAKAFVLRLQLAGEIDLDSPRFNTALDRLVPLVLTAQERANATAP